MLDILFVISMWSDLPKPQICQSIRHTANFAGKCNSSEETIRPIVPKPTWCRLPINGRPTEFRSQTVISVLPVYRRT